MNKGILIDPTTRTISEVEVADWRAIAPLIDADLFDIIRWDTASVYVDDEGIYTKCDYFTIVGRNFPIMGKGLVLGCDAKGETIDCPLDLKTVSASVVWGT